MKTPSREKRHLIEDEKLLAQRAHVVSDSEKERFRRENIEL